MKLAIMQPYLFPFNMLASAKEGKRINPVNSFIDRRTNGAKAQEVSYSLIFLEAKGYVK